jgi:hypothetical protein
VEFGDASRGSLTEAPLLKSVIESFGNGFGGTSYRSAVGTLTASVSLR